MGAKMRAFLFSLAIFALVMAGVGIGHAQVQSRLVVSSCGGQSYTAGHPQPATQNTAGQDCGASTTTPGGTQTVNGADPCFASVKSYADFESTTSGGSIITAASGKKAYLCSISIVTSAAANVSLIEGTGSSVCTGGTPAAIFLNTGTTAANGAAFAANGGIQAGNGNGTVAANGTANYNICVIFSTTNAPTVNAHVGYVQQ